MELDPGTGDDHRAAGAGEIACDVLDLLARNIASGGEIAEIGVGDEHSQFRYARSEFGAANAALNQAHDLMERTRR